VSYFDSRKTTISAAIVIALVLIVGAYVASGRHLTGAQPVSAESNEEILKAYATKDSDSDGLPDWEEALYGTSPTNAHSVRDNLTDSQAVAQGLATPRYAGQNVKAPGDTTPESVPGTAPAANSLTEQFSRVFFDNYMSTRGDKPPTAEESQKFVQSAVAELVQSRVRADAYSASDVRVSGTGTPALITYAVQAEKAFKDHSSGTPYGEITYFSDAVERGDKTAIANLKKRADSYQSIARALIAIPTPQEAAQVQLAFVNGLARVGGTVEDLSTVIDDPIRGMLGLGSYTADAQSFAAALAAFGEIYKNEGVTIAPGEPGYGFYKTAVDLTEQPTTTP
jgi:hypothetical protein